MARKRRGIVKLLGSLHGEAPILVDGEELGSVLYEIDAYSDPKGPFADGRIEGERRVLDRAFDAGRATLVLGEGESVEVVVAAIEADATAEITMQGPLPGL